VVAESTGDHKVVDLCMNIPIDVVVTDLELATMDAIELIKIVSTVSPETRVLILTSVMDSRVVPLIASGAAGYLLKNAKPEAISSAVVSVHLGEQVLCREAAQWFVRRAPSPSAPLTKRELAVLRMVATGSRNKDIAENLRISEKTVRNYVSRLYGKLALNNRVQMAMYAMHTRIASHVDSISIDNRSILEEDAI